MAPPITAGNRQLSYERWQKFCGFLGGGIGGLLIIGGFLSDPLEDGPHWVRAAFVTLVIVAGALLGRAYVGYVQSAHNLKAAGLPPDQDVTTSDAFAYPYGSYRCFLAALAGIALAAACLLIDAWIPVFR